MKKFIKLIACLAEPAYRHALAAHGVAAGVEHAAVLRRLGDCKTVVDIGANRGQFALITRRCFSDAKVVSFEPLPGPVATFRAVFDKDSRVTLHRAAIGPEKTTTSINVSQRDDSSSLLPITTLQESLFPGTGLERTEEIDVGPLDAFLDRDDIVSPALLKLDVQGYELEALKGCETLLSGFEYVYAECSFVELYAGQALADEIIAFLRERGFRLQGVYNMTCDEAGRAVQADFLFRRWSRA